MQVTVSAPIVLAVLFAGSTRSAASQAAGAAGQQAPPPATKLEAFRPDAGTVVTLGYDDLGRVGGISVDVWEFRDARGAKVRGLVVEVTESEYRQERAFIDADEITELIKGVDALLQVGTNPTSFKNFEVRYTTRGELQLTDSTTLRESSGTPCAQGGSRQPNDSSTPRICKSSERCSLPRRRRSIPWPAVDVAVVGCP
jgi:hypothetical protein